MVLNLKTGFSLKRRAASLSPVLVGNNNHLHNAESSKFLTTNLSDNTGI